jgi:hypothetical protein
MLRRLAAMGGKIERAHVRNPNRAPGAGFLPSEMEVLDLHKSGAPQTRGRFVPVTYEYWAPFNYPNVCVELGRDLPLGQEYNPDGVELDFAPYGAITVEEESPIVSVAVIGSACQSPGYVILHADPVEWKYPRTAVKMKADNLWGEHVRGWIWLAGADEGTNHAGLSCAHFDIPDSRKVTITGGSSPDVTAPLLAAAEHHAQDIWNPQYAKPDGHYCVRLIRVTVKEQSPT